MALDLCKRLAKLCRALALVKRGNRRLQGGQFLYSNRAESAASGRHIAHLLQAVKAKVCLDRFKLSGKVSGRRATHAGEHGAGASSGEADKIKSAINRADDVVCRVHRKLFASSRLLCCIA